MDIETSFASNGSEVLSFDTEISRDHHWGPRVFIFVSETDYPKYVEKIKKTLSENLPYDFMGYSTNYSKPAPNGVRHAIRITKGTVNHMVDVFTVKGFWEMRLKFNPKQNISVTDWLTFPQQRLLEMTSGEVFHSGLKEVTEARKGSVLQAVGLPDTCNNFSADRWFVVCSGVLARMEIAGSKT